MSEDEKIIDLCIKRLGLSKKEYEEIERLSQKTLEITQMLQLNKNV